MALGSDPISICFAAVATCRMYDTNRSGWWILLPTVNLVFSLLATAPGLNKSGPSSKYCTTGIGSIDSNVSGLAGLQCRRYIQHERIGG